MAVVDCFRLCRGRVQHIASRGSAALRVSEQGSETRADRRALAEWHRTLDCDPEAGRTSPTDSGRPALVGGRAGVAVADLPGMDRTVRTPPLFSERKVRAALQGASLRATSTP